MTLVVVGLILTGILLIFGSFFLQEKLSGRDLEQITKLSEHELKVVAEQQLKGVDGMMEDKLEEIIEEKLAVARREMERTSNEKIMAINEYSDTVLDAINKSHNEIMFLYSMLNDKHKELTGLAGELQEFSIHMKHLESNARKQVEAAVADVERKVEEAEPVSEEALLQAAVDSKGSSDQNHNDDILFLHSAGKSDVDIAKELGLGLGEVKLVIGLFDEVNNGEV